MPVSRPDRCRCPQCLQGIDHPDGKYHRELIAFLGTLNRVLARFVRPYTLRSNPLVQSHLRLSHQTTVWRGAVVRAPKTAFFPAKGVPTTRLRNQRPGNSSS